MKKYLLLVAFVLFILSANSYAFIDVSTIEIPDEYGKISEKYQGTTPTVVFVISDIHDNFQAQESISRTIEYIVNYYNTGLVCLEGAHGEVDTTSVRSYYNQSIRRDVCQYYMQKAYMSGALYSALVASPETLFLGVEDKDLYSEQYNLYVSSFEERQNILQQINALRESLNKFKPRLFPRELLELEESFADYHRDTISLIDYANILLSVALKYDVPFMNYSNMHLLRDIRNIEGEIDYARIDDETEVLISALKKAMGKDIRERAVLNDAIKQYESKLISEDDFYDVLYALMLRYQVDNQKFSNISKAVQRAQILKKIDMVRMYNETTELYPLIENKLLQNTASSPLVELIALTKALNQLSSVVTLDASREEVDAYFKNKENFSSPRFISFIRDNAMKYDVGYRIDPRVVLIDHVDTLIRSYYDLSSKRSDVLLRNSLHAASSKKIDHFVIVSGTFHAVDVIKELRAKEVTYVLINPYISHLHSSIDIVQKQLGSQPQIKNFISTYAQHLKPWETLSPFDSGSDVYFRYLLNIEYYAYDVVKHLENVNSNISDVVVTRAIYSISEENAKAQIYPIKVLNVVEIKMLNKLFVDVQIGEGEKLIRLLVEPLSERTASYADETVNAISPLNLEQLDRGLFRSSDRLLNILTQEYDARIFAYNSSIIPQLQDEIKSENQKKEKEHKRLIEKVEPQLIPSEKTEEKEADAVNSRLSRLKEIDSFIDEKLNLEKLTELESEFLLLKSQLSFYVLSQTNKTFLSYLEEKIKEKTDTTIHELEMIDAQKKAENDLRLEKEKAERNMEEALEQKKKRKVVNEIIDAVALFKRQVDEAASLSALNDIEDAFNSRIATLKYNDLTKEDRMILTAFKISWEAKYSSLKKQTKTARDEPAIVSTNEKENDSSAHSAVIEAYVQQAFNLKELVDFSSMSSDAQFIYDEFTKLKAQEHYEQLSDDEKEAFEKIEAYILEVRDDLKSGNKRQRQLLLKTLSLDSLNDFTPVFHDKRTEDYIAEVYTIRNKVMQTKSLSEVKGIYALFDDIDTSMKKRELTDSQKEILADTERMITAAIQHYEMQVAREAEKDQEKIIRQKEIEKQRLLRELLGEKEIVESTKKIFFIEDNTFERDMVSKRLGNEGFIVKEAESFHYDLSYFFANEYDLILLDDDIIASTTGIDFIIQLKKSDKHNSLPPVLIHTNNSKSWIYGVLKRKGIDRNDNVYIVSKRDLDSNINFMNELVQK
jgi:CheY-like chemotaxis protein